jgi:hypothetical protein
MKQLSSFKAALAIMLFLVCSVTFAQKGKEKKSAVAVVDTADCLIFTGKLDGSMKNALGDYTVKIIRDNKVIERQTLSVKKPFRCIMGKNEFYTLTIEKEGFIPRLFSISTTLPNGTDLSGDLYHFNFETNLISSELYHQFDDDDMDFPLALISYGKSCDCFEYDKKYTEKIMSRIINRILNGA